MSRVQIVIILTAVILAVVPMPADWVERLYSRQFYLMTQNVMTPISGMIDIALLDLLLGAVFLGGGGWCCTTMLKVGRSSVWRASRKILINAIVVVAGAYLVFLVFWGLNYRREPLTEKLDYNQARVTPKRLSAVAMESVGHLNRLHRLAHNAGWPGLADLPTHLGPSFNMVQRYLSGTRTAVAGRPKTSILTAYFRRAGIDGMINPFSLEILVNESVLPFERPFVVAHEWAHLAGYADESEASFVGWLTCLAGDDSSRYSAWLFLTPRLIGQLNEEEQAVMWKRIDDKPIADLRAVTDRMKEAVPFVQRSANQVYDQYLKANKVEAGIASYDEVVDLVLGTKVSSMLW